MISKRTDCGTTRQNDRRPRLSKWCQITLRGMFGCVLLVAIVLGWGVHQHRCFLVELRTASVLVEKHGAALSGPEQAGGFPSSLPLWDVRQIKYRRLYDPITEARFSVLGAMTIDESAWDLLISMDYLDTLWIQESQLPESATFSPFSKLKVLIISKSLLHSAQFASIGSLSHLVELQLFDVDLNDDDLTFIERLKELELVNLETNPLTDNSAKYLHRLENLQHLSLSNTTVTGAVLQELTCQRSLKRLHLTGVCVRDNDLRILNQFANLEELSLVGTRITDAGVHWLTSLENLRYLYLSDTDVGDESVKLLSASCTNIKRLDMEGTRISEASVPLLLKMPSLDMDLCMFGRTNISDASLSRLRDRSESHNRNDKGKQSTRTRTEGLSESD